MIGSGDRRSLNGDFGEGKELGSLFPFGGLHVKGSQRRSNVNEGRVEHSTSLNAIHKLERRLRRSKRKIIKKKLLSEIGVKVDKLNLRNKYVSASSFSSDDIWNMNSIHSI